MTQAKAPRIKFLNQIILESTVFVCGALVMIYEIIGSRLLSPYLGASTYVWTSLIGVILAALSLGYWLGGKIADRRPEIKILAFVIFLAGGLVSVTIFSKDIILSFIAGTALILEVKTLIAALLLFAPASILLGFVTPYAVKLKMSSLEHAGKTVGRLYALSTVGSILGTFLAGFFLIPFVGSTRTLYLIAACLIGLSLLLVSFTLKLFNLMVLIFFALSIAANELKDLYLLNKNDLHDFDTEYSRVQVFKTKDAKTKKEIQVIATDPFLIQTGMFLDSDDLVFPYAEYYHLLRHFKPNFKKTLMIGGAGYSFPKAYLQIYKTAEMDVVEIDPQMTEIARRFFRLQADPRLKIIHQDGRAFLNTAESNRYDAVLMDAFGSLFSVPFQLTTIESVREFNRVLNDDGVVIFNLVSAIDGDASRFLQAELKTYREVFPNVFLFKVNSNYEDRRVQNLIIVASKNKNFDLEISDDAELRRLLSHLYKKEFDSEINILTDDLAPVEYYNSFGQSVYRRIN